MTLDGGPTIGIGHGCVTSSAVDTACTADPTSDAAPAGPTQPRFTTLCARLPLMALFPRGALRGGTVALASGIGPQRIHTPPISVQSSVCQPHPTYPKHALILQCHLERKRGRLLPRGAADDHRRSERNRVCQRTAAAQPRC